MQTNPFLTALLLDIQSDINYMKRLLEKINESKENEKEINENEK